MCVCVCVCVCVWVQRQSQSQLYVSAPMTHIGDVFVPLPWLQARYRKEHAQQRSAPSLPLVENLLKDNTDGCALTTLLHFYCSQAIRLEGGADCFVFDHTHLTSLTTPSFIVIITESKQTRLKSVQLLEIGKKLYTMS